MMERLLRECRLCPRDCGANRWQGQKGFCGVDKTLRLARAALHPWEEPCLIGEKGSGAVFFSGCGLKCVYCQNYDIAVATAGEPVEISRLAEIFLELQDQGAANINLVTAAQYVPQTVRALELAKEQGLTLPVVYNSGGYEKVETLKLLEGLVDVWLPDYKYRSRELARRLSRAEDYPEQAARALDEMVRQAGGEAFAADGRMLRGVIVRHLVLPGQKEDSKAVVRFLRERYGDRIYLSLLKQYTPLPRMRAWPQLNRRVTTYEYRQVVDYALSLGVTKGYMQKGETAKESFIPAFDGQGVARGKDESDEISDICGGRVSGGQPDS